jgi:hypothetical protein
MTEQTFINLGFERNDVPMEESGCDFDFYYYTLDIGDICLMSDSDDVVKEKGWSCCIFDSMSLEMTDAGDLEDLIRILKNNLK